MVAPISREFVAARVGIDYPFATGVGSGKIYLEGGYARRSVSLKQKRSDDAGLVWDPAAGRYVSRYGDLPATRELEVTANMGRALSLGGVKTPLKGVIEA